MKTRSASEYPWAAEPVTATAWRATSASRDRLANKPEQCRFNFLPFFKEGCVSKNSTGHSNPSSLAIIGRTSSSLATALFAVILVLLGVMVVLVVAYVVRRVRLSR